MLPLHEYAWSHFVMYIQYPNSPENRCISPECMYWFYFFYNNSLKVAMIACLRHLVVLHYLRDWIAVKFTSSLRFRLLIYAYLINRGKICAQSYSSLSCMKLFCEISHHEFRWRSTFQTTELSWTQICASSNLTSTVHWTIYTGLLNKDRCNFFWK